jgi:predicted membrane channel-forming protein YqfA (hemolysin III family)
VKCSERSATLLEKLDHIGIYLVIAGTYTPICLLLIKGSLGVWMLSLQWSAALIGIAMTLSRAPCGKRTTAILFLLMGWSVLLILPTLLRLLILRRFQDETNNGKIRGWNRARNRDHGKTASSRYGVGQTSPGDRQRSEQC